MILLIFYLICPNLEHVCFVSSKLCMSDTMGWPDSTLITLTFSARIDKKTKGHELMLTYSTDALDRVEALDQAWSLAHRHVRNIERAAGRKVPRKHYAIGRATGSILIKALAIKIDTLQLDEDHWSFSVLGRYNCGALFKMLRLPDSSIQIRDEEEEVYRVGILRQLTYAVWKETVGEPDELREKRAKTSFSKPSCSKKS